jgi:regulatory protein
MSYNLNMKSSPAMDVAFRIISYEPQFSGVLRNKLLKKGFNLEQVTQALQQLEELEMLDDERLAKIYAGDLMRVKFYGPMVVRAKLYEKGVNKSLAENAVRQALEDNDGEIELCRKCLNKKIDSQADLKTKLRRLATKGFSGSAIRAVLKNTDEYFID